MNEDNFRILPIANQIASKCKLEELVAVVPVSLSFSEDFLKNVNVEEIKETLENFYNSEEPEDKEGLDI